MSDSYKPLLAAIIARLKADVSITSQVGQRIYNDVPDNETFPYISVTISSSPFDTKTGAGMEHNLQFNIYSRQTSSNEAATIRAAIYNSLNRQESVLSAAGVDVIIFNGVAPTFKEPDGKTWNGVIQFKVMIGD